MLSSCYGRILEKKQILGMQFYRQKPIAGYIADFYCAKAKLVIELDGEIHNSIEAKQYDAIRDQVMLSLGLTVLRFTNNQIESSLDEVLGKIINNLSSTF
jgi:very-short-patch-repair endonuclease